MNITVIHSRPSGSTHTIADLLLDEIKKHRPDTVISEFCILKVPPCTGCFSCFAKGEEYCPHYVDVNPIISSIDSADAVILDSPVYVLGMSGQMKCFLDHMAYHLISHRPHPSVFSKIGIVITTTASVGARRVAKELGRHFFWWGIPKSFRLAVPLFATNWNDVSKERKDKISRIVKKTVSKIIHKVGHVKPGIKTHFLFSLMKIAQKKNNWYPLEKAYWKKQGWI
ncbi:MAG: flavodoxin family protein [Firmicutes bacterium]|nr:flavodoxin family protein [Bacillota bacterium]